MLNISENSVNHEVDKSAYRSFQKIKKGLQKNILPRTLIILLVVTLVILMLPWTQNIRATGNVIALKPDQRPQTIHSVISGRIEQWHVQEGQYVKKGDTILYISEIKDEYFDPNLLGRTQEQLKAKEMTVKSYMEKVNAMDNQIDALQSSLILKKEQALNKLKQAYLKAKIDSVELGARKVGFDVATQQFSRMEELYKKGLKSLTEMESRKMALQDAQAKLIGQENKLLTTRNEIINAQIELSSIDAEYKDKISKSESEKYSSLSDMYDAEAVVTKLQNQYMNYSVRRGMYYITCPQNGYVTKAIRSGIGETIKEGTAIVSIMPASYDLAVEIYVKPIDMPLLEKGQPIRVQFDGWPAVVFSGWPNVSYGTYGAKISAIDNFISDNGKYRLLAIPDTSEHTWPKDIRVGAGANSMILLKDVPVWYELWRQINGFPPDYYKTEFSNEKNEKK